MSCGFCLVFCGVLLLGALVSYRCREVSEGDRTFVFRSRAGRGLRPAARRADRSGTDHGSDGVLARATGRRDAIVDSRMAPYVVDAARVVAAMAPHDLKEGFRKTYAQVKSAWGNASEKGIRNLPDGEKKRMKDKFDGLVEHLLDGGILPAGGHRDSGEEHDPGRAGAQQRQPVRRQQAAGHSSQYAAAEDGGVRAGQRRAHAPGASRPLAPDRLARRRPAPRRHGPADFRSGRHADRFQPGPGERRERHAPPHGHERRWTTSGSTPTSATARRC